MATIAALVLLLQFKTHPTGTSGAVASLGSVPVLSPDRLHTAGPKRRHRARPISTPTFAHHHTASATPTATATTARPSPSATASRTVTATGQTINTQFGPVQVRIAETGGQLTSITAIQLPNDSSHSAEIAAHAVPILRSEALRANSAHIDVVSGATYTSDGYAQSLQSALDNA